jgi:hypothetical protein
MPALGPFGDGYKELEGLAKRHKAAWDAKDAAAMKAIEDFAEIVADIYGIQIHSARLWLLNIWSHPKIITDS